MSEHLDSTPDGFTPNIHRAPVSSEPPWFPPTTEVIYVNGIATDGQKSGREADAYAAKIHHDVKLLHIHTDGRNADVLTAMKESLSPELAYANKPEIALAREVVQQVEAGRDVHILGYSRGALVTQRGLELAAIELAREGRTLAPHVSVDTINGASHDMPEGVRAVHYVRSTDALVSQPLGESGLSPFARTAASDLVGALGGLPLQAVGASWALRDGVLDTPRGPVISVPGISGDLLAQHDMVPMLDAYKPFDQTYGAWRVAGTPHPQPSLDLEHAQPAPPQHPRETPARANVPEGPAPNPQPSLDLEHVRHPRAAKPDGLETRASRSEGLPPNPQPSLDGNAIECADIAARMPGRAPNGVPFPQPNKVEPWDGKSRSGTLFKVDDETYAMHVGRGTYMTFDVQQNLRGVSPPEVSVGRVSPDVGYAPQAPALALSHARER